LYHWFLLLDQFCFCEIHFTTYQRFVAVHSAISPFLGGYICTRRYIYAFTHKHIQIYIHIHRHIRIYARIYLCLYVYIYIYVCIFIHQYINTHTHAVYIHIFMYIFAHKYKYIYSIHIYDITHPYFSQFPTALMPFRFKIGKFASQTGAVLFFKICILFYFEWGWI